MTVTSNAPLLLNVPASPPRSANKLSVVRKPALEKLEPLDADEEKLLASCERTIQRTVESFVATGQALLAIRDKRLYRAEFGNFAVYCKKRWNMARSQADRLCSSAKTYAALEDIPVKPVSEGVLRPLTALKPAQAARVWEAITRETSQENVRTITANFVTRQMKKMNIVPIPSVAALRKAERKPAVVESILISKVEILKAIDDWAKENNVEKLQGKTVFSKMRSIIAAL